jgi:hypothetical protein
MAQVLLQSTLRRWAESLMTASGNNFRLVLFPSKGSVYVGNIINFMQKEISEERDAEEA